MATITYGRASIAVPETKPAAKSQRPNWFARFVDRLVEAQMRKAQRDIERYRYLLPEQFERDAWKVEKESKGQLPFVR
jgi:hypothetical protein